MAAAQHSMAPMKGLGWIIIFVGLALGAWGFFFDPSVALNLSPEAGLDAPDRVINLDLLRTQILMFIVAGALFASGCAVAAAGQVIEIIRASSKDPAISEPNTH